MSEMREDNGQPEDARAASIGLPEENGWTMWASGCCSLTGCIEAPIAAIERARGPRRPSRWQPYCAAHARERGVERADGALVWTVEFLSPRNRDRPKRDRGVSNTG